MLCHFHTNILFLGLALHVAQLKFERACCKHGPYNTNTLTGIMWSTYLCSISYLNAARHQQALVSPSRRRHTNLASTNPCCTSFTHRSLCIQIRGHTQYRAPISAFCHIWLLLGITRHSWATTDTVTRQTWRSLTHIAHPLPIAPYTYKYAAKHNKGHLFMIYFIPACSFGIIRHSRASSDAVTPTWCPPTHIAHSSPNAPYAYKYANKHTLDNICVLFVIPYFF